MLVDNNPAGLNIRVGQSKGGVHVIVLNSDIIKVMIVKKICLRKSKYMWVMILNNSLHLMDSVLEICRTLVKMCYSNAMLPPITICILGMEIWATF